MFPASALIVMFLRRRSSGYERGAAADPYYGAKDPYGRCALPTFTNTLQSMGHPHRNSMISLSVRALC